MINKKFATGMREATRLTRAGQLQEAVGVIQRTLKGGPAPESGTAAQRAAADNAIEVHSRVLHDDQETYPHDEPQRHSFSGPAASPGHEKTDPGADVPPHIGNLPSEAGLAEKLRRKLPGFGKSVPWPKPGRKQIQDIVPEGGRFVSGAYTSQAGKRKYKLYIPGSYEEKPLPLVVMLHGCTQNPDDFAAGTRMNMLAEEYQCLVVYPAQSRRANISKCWNWFQAADQQRDGGEPSLIAGITRRIMDSYPVDPRRVYVAGMSAGGAMAMTMAMTYPDLYAAVGVHSGIAYAVAHDLSSAYSAMKGGDGITIPGHSAGASTPQLHTTSVPAIVFHGDQDHTVHPCNGEQVIAQCASSQARRGETSEGSTITGERVTPGQTPQGRSCTRTTYPDDSGQIVVEHWLIHGGGHAWSGGNPRGSFTDPQGPDASKEMLRFFYEHPRNGIVDT